MSEKISQEERILRHIKRFDSITSWEAFEDYGITRLSAKIFNLRERGFKISGEWVERTNRFGEPVRFKRYFLE